MVVKILIVEDESVEAMDIKRTLESFNYEVPYIASTGEEAIVKVRELMPDLILMDIILKGDYNGIKVASKIKDLDIPVIYLTAHSEESTVEKAKLTEPYGYILKPYDSLELKYAIDIALYKKSVEKLRNRENKLRTKSEEDLKLASQYNRSLIEASLDPLVTIGPDGKISDVNKATEKATGYLRENLIGKDFSDYFTDAEKARKGYEQVFKKGFVRDYPLNVQHKDGHITPVLYNATVYKDESGGVVGVFAAARDITEIKKAEKKVLENEENFRAIAENAGEAILIAARDGKHVYANQKASDITGYTIKELLKTDISDIAHPDELNKLMKRHWSRIEGEIPQVPYDTRITRKDGKVVPIELTSTRTRWKDQYANMVIFRDISRRIKVQKELKRANIYTRTLIEVSLDPLVTIGPDGKITDVNKATENITGYMRYELIGTDFSDYFTDPVKAREGYKKVFQRGFVRDYPLEIQHKDGNVTPVLYNASIYKDESDNVIGIFAAARDITQQRQIINEQKRLNRNLMALSKCNQTMLRAEDEQSLLNDVCSIIFEDAGYHLAWVGYVVNDEAKTIRPMAWAGSDENYVLNAKLSWSEDVEHGKGPAGIVVRTGELIYVQDFESDPVMAPWRRSALEHGYRSGIALPLKDDNNDVFGILMIYSSLPNVITTDEIWLMDELASNLAFGINSLRKQAELNRVKEDLKLASQYNRSLIEAGLDPLVTIGPDGKITDVNKATEDITGLIRDELVGTDFSDYFTDPDRAKDGYKEVFKEGFVRDYPLEIQHKNGDISSVLYNATVYKDKYGDVVGVFAAARDITERKEMEDKLKKSEERMRLTLEAAKIGLWDWDILNDLWYASPTYYTMLGYEAVAGPGNRQEWLDRVHPEDRNKVKGKIDNVLFQNFSSYEYEARMLHADRTYRWMSVSGFGIERDNNGNATRIIGIRMDISERKQAEEDLKLASQYNRSLIEASLDPMVTIGPTGKITDVNDATEEVTGYSRLELVDTDFSDYFTDHKKASEGYEHVFKEGFVRDYPLEIQHRDGHVTPVLYNASVYLNESGDVVGVFAAARDITERIKAEEKIQMLANVVESSDDAIIIKSLDGTITSWNNGAEMIYGYTADEVLGKDVSILAPPGQKDEIKHLIKKIEQGEHIIHYETVRLRKDGTKLDVSLTLSPIFDTTGNLAGISTIGRDITEKKRNENEIIQAKDEWERTFDAVPDLIAILDTDYKIVQANKAMAERLGVLPEEAAGLKCYNVVHGMDIAPSFCPFRKLLEDGKEHTAEVHEDIIGGDFIVSVSPLHDSDGKLLGSVHVARDITDRKKAEDAVKKSLEEKEVLLSEIHHRVKNNMQIISSLLNLQTQYVTDEETVDVLQESQDRVKAMATLYEKLYLSKDLTQINFNNYIESLIRGLFYSHSISEDQIKTVVEIDDIMLNIETAVPCGLIISELVSNSIKHAFPEGKKGKICVSLKANENKNVLIIADNGIGFPENIDFTNTDTLGLKLVNILVDQIDGKITMDKSHGTAFKVVFSELEYKKRI